MKTRAYRSKIGRLPYAVRNELCEKLRDGAVGTAALSWLNSLPEMAGMPRVNAQNLTEWRSTGYRDWLDDQEKTARLRALAETSRAIASATAGDASGVGCRIATAKILDAIDCPEADPDKLAGLTAALARIRAADIDEKKVALAAEKNELSKKQLELSEAKFKRDTCELFLKLSQDQKAVAIADGKGSNEEKVKALLAYMDAEESK